MSEGKVRLGLIGVGNIGNLHLGNIKQLDKVANVRFASVYRQFKDINEFMDELKQMLV